MSKLHPYVSVTVLSVGENACANTSSVRVRIYVTEVDVGRCPYAHITIERSLRHLCLGIYCIAQGMVDDITTSVPYSLKVHCTASIPRVSPGFDVARWILGRLFCSCSLWFEVGRESLEKKFNNAVHDLHFLSFSEHESTATLKIKFLVHVCFIYQSNCHAPFAELHDP